MSGYVVVLADRCIADRLVRGDRCREANFRSWAPSCHPPFSTLRRIASPVRTRFELSSHSDTGWEAKAWSENGRNGVEGSRLSHVALMKGAAADAKQAPVLQRAYSAVAGRNVSKGATRLIDRATQCFQIRKFDREMSDRKIETNGRMGKMDEFGSDLNLRCDHTLALWTFSALPSAPQTNLLELP